MFDADAVFSTACLLLFCFSVDLCLDFISVVYVLFVAIVNLLAFVNLFWLYCLLFGLQGLVYLCFCLDLGFVLFAFALFSIVFDLMFCHVGLFC